MSFFEAVVDTNCVYDGVGTLQVDNIPAACFATRPGREMEDGRRGGMEGRSKRGRAEEGREIRPFGRG